MFHVFLISPHCILCVKFELHNKYIREKISLYVGKIPHISMAASGYNSGK